MLNIIQCLSLTEAANRQLFFRRIKLRRNELLTSTTVANQETEYDFGKTKYIVTVSYNDKNNTDISAVIKRLIIKDVDEYLQKKSS